MAVPAPKARGSSCMPASPPRLLTAKGLPRSADMQAATPFRPRAPQPPLPPQRTSGFLRPTTRAPWPPMEWPLMEALSTSSLEPSSERSSEGSSYACQEGGGKGTVQGESSSHR